ncbi:YMGG-like glycine zipper-containing protein [Rhodobacter ferrooxidans]|uniref:YMGG-like Gly-zipper domain-containing protein n=1 Tax=Rhodobacter ferrooxidans TaxID=371731 RepID=C8S2A6_9RHOB|nr:YMGG-like glycine zipper-containing protein [Rhodobacter sp. SW2]EEW24777.1 conserved hypothetical protein [Rhodobacter sp. SW2]
MKRIALMLSVVALVSACQTQEEQMVGGAAAGAAVGALVTPGNPVKGALIGGAVGLAAGTLLGRDQYGRCVYQRRDGSRYTAAC